MSILCKNIYLNIVLVDTCQINSDSEKYVQCCFDISIGEFPSYHTE